MQKLDNKWWRKLLLSDEPFAIHVLRYISALENELELYEDRFEVIEEAKNDAIETASHTYALAADLNAVHKKTQEILHSIEDEDYSLAERGVQEIFDLTKLRKD